MAEVLAYKCPNCGAPINFNSKSQMMACGSCGTEMDTAAFKAYDAALKEAEPQTEAVWADAEVSLWKDASLAASVCKSCGGELITEGTTVATQCPYCGNAAIMPTKVSDILRPDYVIPFKLDKEAAKTALKKFYKGKPLLPKFFKDDNRIDKIAGMYVPFWLYDCDTQSHAVYNATRIKVWTSGDTRYTKTDYYMVTRDGNMGFEKIPADGLGKMDDTIMESLEPFEYKDLTDFSMAYLSGYMADKYDVTAEENQPRVNQRVRSSVERALRATVHGYSSVSTKVMNVNVKNAQVHYALFPVWMLTTRWGEEAYPFAMNAQTGKLVGELPIDWKKALSIGGIITVLAAGVLGGILLAVSPAADIMGTAAIIAAVLALICALTYIPLFSKKKKGENKKGGKGK